jgi:transcriptional regulator with GAF, ATPase, and Fis domain
MLTGHSSVQNAVKSLNCGAFSYLEKPIDPENLMSVISRGLEKQKLVLENRQLVDELERHNRIANTLLSVSQAVSKSLDLQQIVEAALEEVNKCTGLEVSFIYLLENSRLMLKGTYGFSSFIKDLIPREANMQYGCLAEILNQTNSDSIVTLQSCQAPDLEFLKKGDYHSFAGVPLTLLGGTIGILGAATSFEKLLQP